MTGPLTHSWIWPFAQIWFVDFEFTQDDGERPVPLCVSALELRSGRLVRYWLDGAPLAQAPFAIDDGALMVAFMATAEVSCFKVLGWRLPANLLDLYVEERVATNGIVFDPEHSGRGLLEVLARYQIAHPVTEVQKTEMRALAIRGGPFTEAERTDLMNYCDTDVLALRPLFLAMSASIDMPRALHRGACMAAFAAIEITGTPIDAETLAIFKNRWGDIRKQTAMLAAARFENVYEGLSFKEAAYERYLAKRKISSPRHATGRLKLDDDTFRDMARVHPRLQLLKDARKLLSRLKIDITVGKDGRNRVMLSPFSTKTGRCSPSTTRYIFGAGKWIRPLIKPEPNMAVAYIDWSRQEFGIAAAFSGDVAMQAAYLSNDPYLAFAIAAGAAPAGATEDTHADVRNIFKTVTLGIGYGQSAQSLGTILGMQTANAASLLQLHRRLYPRFWTWSANVAATAKIGRVLETRTRWPLHVTPLSDSDRSLRNFPVQAGGADMLRIACLLAHERGISICGTIHDALLVQAPAHEIEQVAAATRALMREASEVLFGGCTLLHDFALTTSATIVRHPARYPVTEMWTEVLRMVGLK